MVAKILEARGDMDAEVEVVRVIRGDHEPGQRLRMRVYRARDRVGELTVLSDPSSFGTKFPDLSLEFEDEVRWLSRPVDIDSLPLALTLARGYANRSRAEACAYLAGLERFPAGEIVAEIEAVRKEAGDRSYELGCLVDVLLLRESEPGFEWIRREVGAHLARKADAIDWKEPSRHATAEAAFLEALVGACGETWSPMYYHPGRERSPAHAKLRTQVRDRLLAALPELGTRLAAEATHALVWTKTATPAEVEAALGEKGDRDGAALGLLWAARERESRLDSDGARICRDTAKGLTKVPELLELLRD